VGGQLTVDSDRLSRAGQLEGAFFAAVNAVVEPVARAGLLSAPVCALGVISLETTGRRSGKVHRVPVLAMTVGDYLLVATTRGKRSDWFRNLQASPAVHYWLDGQQRDARAILLGEREGAIGPLPDVLEAMASAMTAHAQLLGWRFAVLMPA
jgi:deazaflavin-dependent oxidoreductase (nitroreductase family)